MKRLLLASAAALAAGPALAQEEISMGVVFGFTGPLESLAGPMANGAELAISEVSESGALLDGTTVTPVRGDSTCLDAQAATAAAERLITADGVSGIVGAMCSGTTIAVLQNVAVPNGMVMISPSATSPALTGIDDNGLFFRTAPSDARQGVVMANIILERGIDEVALSYVNNDYGKGLADSFQSSFEEAGGTITIVASHEDEKADYSAEVGALAAGGGEALVIAGYVDGGGSGVLRAALDVGAFDTFVFPDGMVGEELTNNFGSEIDGSFGQNPAAPGGGRDRFQEMAAEAGFDGASVYAGEAYDSASLILLAMQAAGSTDPADYKAHVMDVANAPGEEIGPGELGRALELIASGEDVDYSGASAVELIEPGESAGTFREIEIEGGEIQTVQFR